MTQKQFTHSVRKVLPEKLSQPESLFASLPSFRNALSNLSTGLGGGLKLWVLPRLCLEKQKKKELRQGLDEFQVIIYLPTLSGGQTFPPP